MAFKEVASLDADNTTALGGVNKKTGKKNPTSVEGYFLGSRKVESRKNKNGFAYLHVLKTAKGNLGVWGKTDLDRKFQGVIPGTMVRATHVGMQETPNGTMYRYKVEIDSDNTLDASEVPTSIDFTNNESEEDTEGNPDDTEDYSNDDDEETVAVSLTAAQRRAKVEELLNKGKKA